jgi:tight adherence protein B
MEGVSLLIPGLAFVSALAIGLLLARTAGLLATARRRDLQRRVLEHTESAGNAGSSVEVTSSILKERSFSAIPTLQRALSTTGFADRLAVDLAAARLPLRVGEYLLIRWAFALLFVVGFSRLGMPWILAVPPGILGFYLPRLYVGRRKQQRLQRFNDQIVDALTMIANSMRSGTSFLQAFDLVAHELPAPISEEFGQVVVEVGVGASIEEALENLTKRIDSYDLYLVVSAILVQRQAGGKLAEVLDQISTTVRERVRLLRQVQVLTAQERASAILVGALPIIILIILLVVNPTYHGPFLATSVGRLVMGVGFLFELFGFLVMNRLARIDV